MQHSSRTNRTGFWFLMLFLVLPVALPFLIPQDGGPATFQVVGPAPAAKTPDRAREIAPPPRAAAE